MATPSDPRLPGLRDALLGQVLTGTGRVTYHLRDCVGEGGQGWAFRAHWNDPNGPVVLAKVLRPDTVSLDALRRFQQEADVLRMLSMIPNPHVVRFYDHAVAQVTPPGGSLIALPFTVLEFVNGPSLEQVLKATGALPVQRVRRILRHVATGLDTVHAQKVVHRDLKPSNILLSTDGGIEVAKVTDFGLVKLAELNLVRTAALAGASLGYAPPEQYERGNKRVSLRTDIFSLAAVAYEMLSGKPAFPFTEGENPLVIVTRILNGQRPSLAKVLTTLPRELARKREHLDAVDAIVSRALSADPAHRHESVLAFVGELDAALAPIEDADNQPRSLVSPFEATAPTSLSLSANTFEAVAATPGMIAATLTATAELAPPLAATVPQVARPVGVGSSASGQAFAYAPVPVHAPAPAVGPALTPGTLPYGRPQRFPESVASLAASWRFSAVSTPARPLGLSHASLSLGGGVAALSQAGLLVWERGLWQGVALPPEIDPRLLRGVTWLEGNELLLYGDQGFVAVLSPRGTALVLHSGLAGTKLHHARVFPDGDIWLTGEMPFRGSVSRTIQSATSGVVMRLSMRRVEAILEAPGVSRLSDVARLGAETIACGDRGALVRCEADRAELLSNVCHGDLHAISALPDATAVTVGAGGHALHVTHRRDGILEAVQTTRALLALSVSPEGSAWAGAANARLLRRSNGSWLRMSGDLPSQGNVIALAAHEATVRAVLDDGVLVEGRIVV
jgi:serine/threonine protein kinase